DRGQLGHLHPHPRMASQGKELLDFWCGVPGLEVELAEMVDDHVLQPEEERGRRPHSGGHEASAIGVCANQWHGQLLPQMVGRPHGTHPATFRLYPFRGVTPGVLM